MASKIGTTTNSCLLSPCVIAVLGACAAPHYGTGPAFAPPRDGVFQHPSTIVAGTDDDFLPTIHPSGGLLAYASRASGQVDIYLRRLDGGPIQQLTHNSTPDTDPAFSPDGKHIAWVSQVDDVKGDVWVMRIDGKNKRRLTGAESSDAAPVWAPDGQRIFFASRPTDAVRPRIEVVDLRYGHREVVTHDAWDAAISPDGETLFYAAMRDSQRARLYAQSLLTGAVIPLTDGTFLEGMPVAVPDEGARAGVCRVLFSRFVDDQNNDGRVDTDDPASIWEVEFHSGRFLGTDSQVPPPQAKPLTSGENGEIFVASSAGWLAYTAAGLADLDIYALPAQGMIVKNATAPAILEAARAESNLSIRRLGLRYIVATEPTLAARARYELARDLAEQNKLGDAIEAFAGVASMTEDATLAAVAKIEGLRLKMLRQLGGTWIVRRAADRTMVHETLQKIDGILHEHADTSSVATRARMVHAEAALALGQKDRAAQMFESVARGDQSPSEDTARALLHLLTLYATMGDFTAVERVTITMLTQTPDERFYNERAIQRWISAAMIQDSVPAQALLQDAALKYHALPALAAHAQLSLANLQAQSGEQAAAVATLQAVIAKHHKERSVYGDALAALGAIAEAADEELAMDAFERLGSDFPESPKRRRQARDGITRIALRKARLEEAAGEIAAAHRSYKRLLQSNQDLVEAHRHFIELSWQQGKGQQVTERYRRMAKQDSRNKFSRYGLAYALSFENPVAVAAVERELMATLQIDPRFPAAHLTLGWLKLIKERSYPDQGWLESAQESFETAEQLLEEDMDVELYAATQLNKGNALFALGKDDLSFNAYMARELTAYPFRDALTELIFRTTFARVAMRQEFYDVAIDMARRAKKLALELKRPTHVAAMLSLLGAIHVVDGAGHIGALQQEAYHQAVAWYEAAVDAYKELGHPGQTLAALRGAALAHRWQGNNERALQLLEEMVQLVAQGVGPTPPATPFYVIRSEVPANPGNVTRGVHGFTASQEEELAYTLAARAYRERGDLAAAREFNRKRLMLLQNAAQRPLTGSRLGLELMTALHESALLAVYAGEHEAARDHWLQAILLANGQQRWADLHSILQDLGNIVLADPSLLAPPSWELITGAAAEAVSQLWGKAEAQHLLATQIARQLALFYLAQSRRPHEGRSTPGSSLQVLEQTLRQLDESVNALKQAEDFAYLAGATDILGAIRALSAGSSPKRPLPPGVQRWRAHFDVALGPTHEALPTIDPAHIERALLAFENTAQPVKAPELDFFVRVAANYLLSKQDFPRAWRLLERQRLLHWQPDLKRLPNHSLTKAVGDLRRLSDEPEAYAATLEKSTMLVRAVAAAPPASSLVASRLGKHKALLQVHEGWNDSGEPVYWWFLVWQDTVLFATTSRSFDSIPEAFDTTLRDLREIGARLYFDGGDAPVQFGSLRWQGLLLQQHFELSEVLSATYALACEELKNNARNGAVAIGADSNDGSEAGARMSIPAELVSSETLARRGRERSLMEVLLPLEITSHPRLWPRHTHVVLRTDSSTRINAGRLTLQDIAGLELHTHVAWVVHDVQNVRARRALALAFLLSGVPTVLFGGTPELITQHTLESFESDRISSIVQNMHAQQPGVRIHQLGFHGLDYDERVDFAAKHLLALAPLANAAFRKAEQQSREHYWQEAKQVFGPLIDTVRFLSQPKSSEALLRLKTREAMAIRPHLARLELSNQSTLALIHAALGEIDAAIALQQLVIEAHTASGNHAEALKTIVNLGKTLGNAKEHEEAAAVFQECIDRSVQQNNPLQQADCEWRLGSQLRAMFRYRQAARAYQRSLVIYDSHAHPGQVAPRRYLGYLYETGLNDYDKALQHFTEALALARQHEQHDVIPGLLLETARVLRQQGQYETALGKVEAAHALLHDSPPRQQAEAVLELARIYWYRGNYRRANQRQQEALGLARRAGNAFLEIQSMSLAGLIALNQGELARAQRHITDALHLARATRRASEEAVQLNNLGIVLREAGDLTAAVQAFRDALKIDERLGSVEGIAFDLRNLAVALERQGEFKHALTEVDRSLQLSRSIGNKYNELHCLFARGEIILGLGDSEQAETMFSQTAKLAQEISVPEMEWRSHYALGKLQEHRGNVPLAIEAYRSALSVAERLRHSPAEGNSRYSRNDLYADMIRAVLQQGDEDEAFLLAERARARALLDLLGTRRISLADPVGSKLMEREYRLREKMFAVEQATGLQEGERIAAVDQAKSNHQAAWQALRAHVPHLARAISILPTTSSALMEALPADVVVLSLFVGKDFTLAQTVSLQQVQTRILNIGHHELSSQVSRLHQYMRAFGPVDRELKALTQALLAPLEDLLPDSGTLVLIPHGPLFHVPFAALSFHDTYLIDNLALTLLPSVGSLYDRLTGTRMLAPLKTVESMAPDPALPFAHLEARATATLKAYLGPQATERQLRSVRSDGLNLATHVELDPEDPLGSSLQLASGSNQDPHDDGRLELSEVFGLAHIPSLVTLSACDSGISRHPGGNDWLGLAGTFLTAGADSIVATQNRVSDLAAAILMKRFYRKVRHSGTSRADALREAILWTRAYLPHPAHWANFVLVGDFR